MKFINREEEMKRLDSLADSSESGIAVVWGRRRIGKTRLLLEWSQKHHGVYFIADESTPSVQRKYLAMAIDQALPGFSNVEYPDWMALFHRLGKDSKHAGWRGPLVIDELPYLISASPELPSILQKFIDLEAKQSNLIIALCGSSQRMMQGAILDEKAPLYGRAQELIKLSPISVAYMEEALGIKSGREVIESYSVWGGIPRYWELVRSHKKSLMESIDHLVLDPMSPLNDEPNRLLLEEHPSAINLRPILDAIGLGTNRLSEIATRIGHPTTSLHRPIQRLLELDLIRREVPFGSTEIDSKRSLYKINDPFLRFWFKVVAPQRSLFSQAPSAIRLKKLKEGLPPLFSTMWEDLCRLAIPKLSCLWGEECFFSQAGRYWHGQGPEWDILSESTNGKMMIIGEAKWTEKTPTREWISLEIERLQSKGLPPIRRRSDARLTYALFIPEKPKIDINSQNIKIFDAEDVIRAFRK